MTPEQAALNLATSKVFDDIVRKALVSAIEVCDETGVRFDTQAAVTGALTALMAFTAGGLHDNRPTVIARELASMLEELGIAMELSAKSPAGVQ